MKQLTLAALTFGLFFSVTSHADKSDRGFEKVTTCEVKAFVYNTANSSVVIDEVSILEGGMHLHNGANRCQNLTLRKAQHLCKHNNKKKGSVADRYQLAWGFKAAQIDTNPSPSPCTSPTDPRCIDPLLTAMKLETVAANFKDSTCTELLSKSIPEDDLEF